MQILSDIMSVIKSIYISLYDVFEEIIVWIVKTVGKFGYVGIVLLMGLESSFFPFPSEVVVPPAGYLASQGEMNLVAVIIFGVVGSVLGSLLNYYIAAYLGRAVLIKYSKYFFLNEERFSRFERFFNRHGEITTFVGRLIPGVRQYISFPAGLVKMNIFKFIFYTALGAAIWVTILALVGYIVGNNMDLIKENLHIITYFILAGIFIVLAVYIGFQYYKKRKTIEVK